MIRATVTTEGLGAASALGGGGGGLRLRLQQAMLEGLHSVIDPMVSDVRTQTPYDSIRGAYGTQDLIVGNSVQVAVTNTSPIWPFREFDTAPHFPPWKPGTPLATWADARNIPAFLVARKIAREGTRGNHILRDTQRQYAPRIDQAVQAALYAFVLSSLRGGA